MLQGRMHPLVWRSPNIHNSSAVFPDWHFALLLRLQIHSLISSCVDAVNLPFPPSSIPNALLNTIILSFFAPHTPTLPFVLPSLVLRFSSY
ncbi:hypothetical protein F4824DRAFT_33142 [Ustulina deusta]|nr:hypothetical protein F4824DRAFT_33142 [Ustulina deusta]